MCVTAWQSARVARAIRRRFSNIMFARTGYDFERVISELSIRALKERCQLLLKTEAIGLFALVTCLHSPREQRKIWMAGEERLQSRLSYFHLKALKLMSIMTGRRER
jgi:hypothetical protein